MSGLNPEPAFDTEFLEYGRGRWNSWCSGGMRRYLEEHQIAKAVAWDNTDAEARKHGEQTGLDTLVVQP